MDDRESVKKSYSEFGEDILLETLLARKGRLKADGFYVDIGACWARRFSNTYSFYRRGWSGICIDPRPGFEDSFIQYRPRDKCLNIGVGNSISSRKYYMFENPVFNTFDVVRAQTLGQIGGKGRSLLKVLEVPVRPLNAILEECGATAGKIDFISLDVQGFEMEVLEAFDIKFWKPEIVVVDWKNKRVRAIIKTDLVRKFESNGYKLTASTPQNLFFSL